MCAGYVLVLLRAPGHCPRALCGGDRGRPRDPAARAAADLPGRLRLPRASPAWAPCTASTPTPTSPPKRPPTRSSRSSAGPSCTRPTARCSRSRATRPRRSGSPAGCGPSRPWRSPQPRRGRADRTARPHATRTTRRCGRRAFVGLNPVLLELAVGGAHNDTLMLLLARRARWLLSARAPARASAPPRRALVAGIGVKVDAPGLRAAVPHASRRREHRARAPVGWRGAAGAEPGGCSPRSALIGFGAHALGFLERGGRAAAARRHPQHPAETARLVGLQRHAELVAPPVRGGLRRGARLRPVADARAAPTGAWRPAGRRSRCCCRPPGCCPGMRSGRCR